MERHRILKIGIIVLAFLIVLGGIYYFTTRSVNAPLGETPGGPQGGSEQVGMETYKTTSGLSFTYPDTYVAITPEMLELSAFETVTLFDKDDYEELKNSTEPREGPTSINLQIFNNPEGQSAGTWVLENSSQANYSESMGRLQPRSVVGRDAVAYRFTGLYEGDATVFTAGGKMYLFTVTWLGTNDPIRDDFEKILSSIRF